MDINQIIRENSSQPLTHQLLLSLLKDYKRPNDKIQELKAKGIIEPIKKGLYIAGPEIKTSKPETTLLANHIYGPSYVSLDTALSYHGFIPERVYEITSMTIKVSKEFNTAAGVFTYMHLPMPYYAFGIKMLNLSGNMSTLVASPEKALCDKIVITSGVQLRSISQASAYLLEDLRIERQSLKNLDINMVGTWLADAPKSDSLKTVIAFIRTL